MQEKIIPGICGIARYTRKIKKHPGKNGGNDAEKQFFNDGIFVFCKGEKGMVAGAGDHYASFGRYFNYSFAKHCVVAIYLCDILDNPIPFL